MKHLNPRSTAERVGNATTRTIVEKVDDTKLMQNHSVSGYSGESQQSIEHVHPYGFVSNVQPPIGSGQNRMGAEGFMGFMGGGRGHGVVFVAGDRRYRLQQLQSGEVALHDDQGQQVHMARDGTYVSVPNSQKVTLQVMQSNQRPTPQGQQWGQTPQKGQTAVSTFVMDKNNWSVSVPGAITFNAGSFVVNAGTQNLNGTCYLGAAQGSCIFKAAKKFSIDSAGDQMMDNLCSKVFMPA